MLLFRAAMAVQLLVVVIAVLWGNMEAHSSDISNEIDWSCFETQHEVDVTASLEHIRKLPMHHFWDVLKASFRTGVVGDSLKGSMLPYVNKVERKLTVSGKSSVVESYVLESTVVYMHGIAALQHLIGVSSSLRASLPFMTAAHDYPPTTLRAFGLVAQNGTLSVASLRATKEAIEYRLKSVQQKMVNAISYHKSRLERLVSYGESKKRAASDVHRLMLHDIDSHYSALNASLIATNAVRQERLLEQEALHLAAEKGQFQSLHIVAMNELNREMSLILQANAYRAEEEMLLLEQLASGMHDILIVKASLMHSGLEEMLTAAFSESQELFMGLYRNPTITLQYLVILVTAAVFIIVVVEFSLMMGVLLKSSSKREQLRQANGSSAQSSSLRIAQATSLSVRDFAFREGTTTQLQSISDSIRSAAEHRLPLPNVLISGRPGTGKTTACQITGRAVAVCMRTRFICSGDLQALGAEAGIYLRDIIMTENSRNGAKPMLLVIEDADSIIRMRGSATQGTTSVASDVCLYTLLTSLAETSNGLSLLLTTRLAPYEVDSALTDRIGLMLVLPLPCSISRLRSILLVLGTGSGADSGSELWHLIDPAAQAELQLLQAQDVGEVHRAVMTAGDLVLEVDASILPNESVGAPENDRPRAVMNAEDPMQSITSIATAVRRNSCTYAADHMDVLLCLKAFTLLMEGKSYRDVQKFAANVRYRVMCSERCILTSRIWMEELASLIDRGI